MDRVMAKSATRSACMVQREAAEEVGTVLPSGLTFTGVPVGVAVKGAVMGPKLVRPTQLGALAGGLVMRPEHELGQDARQVVLGVVQSWESISQAPPPALSAFVKFTVVKFVERSHTVM